MKKKKLPGAEELYGVKVIIDPSLPKHSAEDLFPEKLARANYIISRIKNLDEILELKEKK